MNEVIALAADNLISPIILSFALGLLAAFARSDLAIPEAVARGMSIYLLFAIGFKGGAGVAAHGVDTTLVLSLVAGMVLSFGLPVYPKFRLAVLKVNCLVQFKVMSSLLALVIKELQSWPKIL